MRIPRTILLSSPKGHVHLYWRCHNREFYFLKNDIKSLYLACLSQALKHSSSKSIKLHNYCIMGNHCHHTVTYEDGSDAFSNYMRRAHSLFGARFNKLLNRTGKVAESRPKTPLIESQDHLMRVHFYIEANPIRANLAHISNLKNYRYSSYAYFAFGVQDEFTKLLTDPDWYLELGKTARQRQRIYRKLFYAYLKQFGLTKGNVLLNFLGSAEWQEKCRFHTRQLIEKRSGTPNTS